MKEIIKNPSLWVYFSAFLFPINGGLINVVTLMSFLHNSVGYVTGNISNTAIFIAKGDYLLCFRMLILIIFFLLGAIISSLITLKNKDERGRGYITIIITQLFLISVAIILLKNNIKYVDFIFSFVLGIQNSMTTHYGTAMIRTTHMTGTTTDLGISIAKLIKYKNEPIWKIKLYTILTTSFLFGSVLGALLFHKYGVNILFISIFIYVIFLFKYYIYRFIRPNPLMVK
jgi:uncharacterized membrane protein YoaK (UPF0700 family)